MRSNISAWAIRNPIPVIVLFALLTVAGFVSFDRLRLSSAPDIDVPAVIVTVSQPGAAPAEMETQIARKIEDATIGLGGVDHISSTITDGTSITSINFTLDKKTDRAVNDVRDAVTKIRADLPGGIQEPIISRVDVTGAPIVTYAVDVDGLSEEQLSWFIDNDISRALLSVPGVGKVTRRGGVDRAICVNLDPNRLMALGITADQVNAQLRLVNANRPGGRGTVGTSEQSIRTLGSAVSVEDLRQTRLVLSGGRTARLSDLGTVTDGNLEQRQFARLNLKPVVAFDVYRSVGTGEVQVGEHVEKRLKEFTAAHPQTHITLISTTLWDALASYHAAMEALIIGALLAVAVVWWFLRDTRATMISAVAMPLAMLPTFAVMLVFDYSLCSIVLLGLSLVVGILVDDAIVEIENIIRHIKMGKKPYTAALEAADEIGLAVVATTSTIMVVFLPVAFMPGIPGQYFRQFGITVAAAVFFSLAVARLVTPLMAAYLLKDHGHVEKDSPAMLAYLKLLRWALAHRRLTISGGIGFFALSVMLLPLLPTDLLPAGDHGMIYVNVELAPGATLQETDRVVQQVTRVFNKYPEVESVLGVIGGSTFVDALSFETPAANEVRLAGFTVNLKPRRQRNRSQQQIEAEARAELREIPGIRVKFVAANPGVAAAITLVSDNPATLETTTQTLQRQMMGLPGIGNVRSTASLRRPEIHISPNLDKAAELGISVEAISAVAKIATIGDIDANLAKFNLEDRQIPIMVRLDEQARGDLSVLRNLQVSGANGVSVPMDSIADISFSSGPAQIDRLDRRRYATVTVETLGTPLGVMNKMIHDLPIFQNMPPNVSEMKYGISQIMGELFGSIGIAVGSGVLMVYAVLVILFGSFIQPITIMAALPLSLGGAVTLLLLTRNSISMPALIGIMMLMGIVAKNSILLVEYAVVAMRDRGVDRYYAITDAAHKRVRPIVMTTIAMVAGMLPVATGLGEGAEFRAPMGVCVIGGLLTSTGLSLLFVPVAFTYLDELKGYLRLRVRHMIHHSGHGADKSHPAAPRESAAE